ALNSIAVASPRDAWAVGTAENSGRRSRRPLIEHWNGKRWSVVPNLRYGMLAGAAALATDDAWVVGQTGSNINKGQALAEHWDGSKWQKRRVSSAPGTALTAVAAAAADQVWAVGANVQEQASVIFRWDGAGWHHAPGPAQPGALTAIA